LTLSLRRQLKKRWEAGNDFMSNVILFSPFL